MMRMCQAVIIAAMCVAINHAQSTQPRQKPKLESEIRTDESVSPVSDTQIKPGSSAASRQEVSVRNQRQVIRLVYVERIEFDPAGYEVLGKGGAIANGGSNFFFWNSSTPVDIYLNIKNAENLLVNKCKHSLVDDIPEGTAIEVVGKGTFGKVNDNPSDFSYIAVLRDIYSCERVKAGAVYKR